MENSISFISSAVAAEIDKTLMSPEYGYSIDQLVELAGLSVAAAVQSLPCSTNRVLVLCGPGNNGADGLVAARHLKQCHIGNTECSVTVFFPKLATLTDSNHLYSRLVLQLNHEEVPIHTCYEKFFLEQTEGQLESQYDVVVDALFGFGFKGVMRSPYKEVVTLELDSSQSLKVIIEKVHRECNKFIVTQSETDPQITSEQSKKKKRKSDAS